MPITLAHYIGIRPPRCALSYSELPCHAQLGYEDGTDPGMTGLNTESARRNGGLTGAADSKSGTGSLWFWVPDVSGNKTIFCSTTTAGGTTTRFRVRMVGNELRITASDTGGTTRLDIRSPGFEAQNTYHVLFSFDLNVAGRRHIYVDDVSNVTQTTFTNATIDWTVGDWSFGALPNGTESVGAGFYFSQFWFHDGLYFDLTDETNRRKFISSDKRPVWLGNNGEVPTGGSPRVFLPHLGDGWEVNEGTGGGFGTITNDGNAFATYMATGSIKCFNTLATCQDLDNFDDTNSPTIWFGEDVAIPQFKALVGPLFPFIKSIDFQSAIVSLGDNMGQRGSITVTLRDAPHNDLPTSLFDKYYYERSWTPFQLEFGTFWGRFKARNQYIRFAPLYLLTLKRSNDFDDEGTVESRTYAIESISGPDELGQVKITAKDILKVVDGDFAVAPTQSPGFLASDIDDTETELVVSPSGILAEYPSNFYACVGGNEIINCTKTGGDGIHVDRGQRGTQASSHNSQDRVQQVLIYDSTSPDVIIADLLTTYGGVDPALIDNAAWAAEVAANLNTVYTFVITEPTPVNKLVSEIIQQIGGAIWWDDTWPKIVLQILKSVATDAEAWSMDTILAKSFKVTDQESKRVTEVSVYFAQINPTVKVDETRNYASVATVNDETIEGLVGGKSIKTIYARGIAAGGRTVAERLAQKYLSRYVQPPRKFNFQLLKYSNQFPALGGGFNLTNELLDNRTGWGLGLYGIWPQDAVGSLASIPIQITRLNPVGMVYDIEAEEVLYTAYGDDIDPTNHTVIFDVSRNNVNLEETHNNIYAVAQSGDTVNCYVNGGVTIGSTDIDVPAFIVGSFAGGVTVNLFINGRIQGKGGNGGAASASPAGQHGGTALYTRQAINVENNSQIWGGGGGGGGSINILGSTILGAGGGGGAGTTPGAGGTVSTNYTYQYPGGAGSTESGGSKTQGFAGNGGNPGQAGQNASGGNYQNGAGGAAGAAVDGNSFITYSATGDRQGSLIN